MSVVPDSIEAVEGWRSWNFDKTGLKSVIEGIAWPAGKEMQATCTSGINSLSRRYFGPSYRLELVRNGWSREKCIAQYAGASFGTLPAVEPPPGFGYQLVPIDYEHESPSENCTCGIYAGTDMTACPTGHVFGKVKMWGKVVPGERGWRAQYAYPSELHVPARLATHPALLAYGVPIVVTEDAPLTIGDLVGATPRGRSFWTVRKAMWFAVAVNLGSAAFNLGRLWL